MSTRKIKSILDDARSRTSTPKPKKKTSPVRKSQAVRDLEKAIDAFGPELLARALPDDPALRKARPKAQPTGPKPLAVYRCYTNQCQTVASYLIAQGFQRSVEASPITPEGLPSSLEMYGVTVSFLHDQDGQARVELEGDRRYIPTIDTLMAPICAAGGPLRLPTDWDRQYAPELAQAREQRARDSQRQQRIIAETLFQRERYTLRLTDVPEFIAACRRVGMQDSERPQDAQYAFGFGSTPGLAIFPNPTDSTSAVVRWVAGDPGVAARGALYNDRSQSRRSPLGLLTLVPEPTTAGYGPLYALQTQYVQATGSALVGAGFVALPAPQAPGALAFGKKDVAVLLAPDTANDRYVVGFRDTAEGQAARGVLARMRPAGVSQSIAALLIPLSEAEQRQLLGR